MRNDEQAESPDSSLFQPGTSGNGSSVQSVDRAVTILELLARHGELGVTDLSTELGVHKSTAFRLVGALEVRGLVEQAGPRGKYRLGFGIIRLAGARAASDDLVRQSHPVCEELAAEVGETVNVAIAGPGAGINLTQVRGSAAVVTQNWVGRRTPLHATSSGKVLLAYMSQPTLSKVLRGRRERFTPGTITNTRVLRTELRRLRERGYAEAVEEFEVGLNAVAAPIWDLSNQVVASVSVSGPSYRLTEDDIARTGKLVARAGMEISRRLGYLGD
ncbi:MAG: IclR family transcriptional regulator [Streptosporangiaceae bacterium]